MASQPEGTESGERTVPDLLALAAEIVAIPSVSHSEQALADAVESDLRAADWLSVERIGDTIVARTDQGRDRRVVIAGHLDTVPGDGEVRAEIDGEVLFGLGSSDMKGGLAVMLALAAVVRDPAVDVTYLFYPCEEVGREHNGLALLAKSRPDLLQADAAVLGEPTFGFVEAGCQGTLRGVAHISGRRAHTARPFMGVNAIHRAAGLLDSLASYESRHVVIDGCEYAEQLQAVRIDGGIASNVVPDSVAVTVNFRFAPDRSGSDAEDEVRRLVAPGIDESAGDRFEILEVAPGAPPSLTQPLLSRLVAASGSAPRAKVGWTDAATFFANGIPAANFGPGDPLLAHTKDEKVSRAELESVYDALFKLLTEA
ncbi:MAG: succinyl-diaminopimelate desuccinylase [Acidimicrobiales bacterium]|jgi:succinyl-diaminopimelate desuccinylase